MSEATFNAMMDLCSVGRCCSGQRAYPPDGPYLPEEIEMRSVRSQFGYIFGLYWERPLPHLSHFEFHLLSWQ